MKHESDYSNKQQLIIFICTLVLVVIGIVTYINYRQKTMRLESVPNDLAELKKDIGDVTQIVKKLAISDSLQQSQLNHFPTAPLSITDMSKVSSVFSVREDPVYGGREFHTGIDYNADYGSIVHAAATGIVKTASYQGGYGNTIRIDHGNGYKTSYSHLANMTVIQGELVNKGDTIGNVGRSGKTTGAHLHYEITFTDMTGVEKKINPIYFTKTSI